MGRGRGLAAVVAAALTSFGAVLGAARAQDPPPLPVPTPQATPPVAAPAAPSVAAPAAPAVATPAAPVVTAPAQTVPSEAAPPAAVPTPSLTTGADRIIGIKVVGYQTVSPDTIAHYLGIKIGDVYDPEKIRQNFHALWDVGLLENVHIEAEREAGGVTLLVTIEERPIIKDIEFTGNKKLSSSQVRDVLKEGKAEVKVGGPLSLRDIARARAVIAEAYIAQGFRSATVDYKIEDLSKTEKKVIFQIDEGDKVKIASISFTGNENVSAQTLRNAMHKTKVAVFWRILSDNTVYSQANYEADVESLKGVYQARGYKDVVIKDPILDVYVTNPDAKPEKIKRKVRLTIPIVEGDKFFTNDLTVVAVRQNGQPTESGQTEVFPNQQLVKQFYDLQPGSVLNRDRIVEGLAQIETLYKSRGFIYSYPNPVFKELPDHRVDVEVQIFEGDKFYLGRLEVQGNTMTRDKVIRREFALDEGDVMDMEAVKKSVTKIQQLGYFKMTEEPQFGVNPEEKKVDIVIKGQETSRNEIQFGAGYSGFDGFFGQFSFQTRNFLGRGEIIGASAQLGKVSNFFDLSYTVPWFMDRNQSVGGALFRRNVDYLSQEEKRLGGSLFYAKGLSLFDSASLLYSYEDITANFPVRSAPVPPGQPEPPQKFTETTGTTSSLTPGYRYDSRNDPFDPTRGFRLSATVQLAPSVFGGTSDFFKAIGGATVYLPVRLPRGAIVALNFEAGYVAPFGQVDIPIFERFQLGGEQSLRGFQQGAAVPVDPDTLQVFTDPLGRILGGNKFFVLNVEYQFLTIGPAKLLAFFDVGQNYFDTQHVGIGNVRASAGAELRIFLPIFQAPLRFIYAFNLHPITPVDQFGFPIGYLAEKPSGFTFSIGRTF